MFSEIDDKTLANFLLSSGRCEYHCCAGPIRAFWIMAIRFKIQVSGNGESVCSGPAVITIIAVIAVKKSSVVQAIFMLSKSIVACVIDNQRSFEILGKKLARSF